MIRRFLNTTSSHAAIQLSNAQFHADRERATPEFKAHMRRFQRNVYRKILAGPPYQPMFPTVEPEETADVSGR